MKLIEKLAKDWLNEPKYESSFESIYSSKLCYDPEDAIGLAYNRSRQRAYEAGFLKAREMAVVQVLAEPYMSPHANCLENRIRQLGEETV